MRDYYYNTHNEEIDLADFSPYKLGWDDLNYEQLEARVITARELRSHALGEFLVKAANATTRALRSTADAIAELSENALRKRSHS